MKFPGTVQLAGSVELAAPSDPAAAKPTKRLRQRAHAGSRVQGMFADFIYELSGMTTPKSLPFLQQHDHTKIVGLATHAAMTPEGLILEGDMYDTQAARDVQQLSEQGFPWQASIGVRTLEAEYVEEGEERAVNGRKEKGPFVLVTKSRVYESSVCPVGADGNTSSAVLAVGGAGDVEVKRAELSAKETKMSTTVDPVAEERKRVSAIKQRFSKNAEHALKHIELGSSLLEAEADYAKELEQKLEKALSKPQPLPEVPGRLTATGGGTQSAIDQWNEQLGQLLSHIPVPTGKQRGDAVARLAKSNPQLHQAYLEEFNATRPARARS